MALGRLHFRSTVQRWGWLEQDREGHVTTGCEGPRGDRKMETKGNKGGW